MTEFEGVAAPLADALRARGYETLTPVQSAMLQPGRDRQDLLVSAQTGSGKTVAFGLAFAHTLLGGETALPPPGDPLALVVAPTRELALQVRAELEWLYALTGATLATCVGGMDPRAERRRLEAGAHIVVGTPGRLRDHITRRAFSLEALRAVVLDEADEMLDLGFREDLEFILGECPRERRTLLFSATVPPTIEKLARTYQRDAQRVATDSGREPHADIAYQALMVASHDRENAVVNVLRYHEAANALVFCNTRAAVQRLTGRFHNRGFSVVALSGELTQGERSNALQALRDGRAKVCIATDVAARGIDLPNLELVVHNDLPSNPETLLHRSGRTGRAGRKGISALIVDPRSRGKAERLLRMAGVEAEWTTPPSADAVLARDEERTIALAAQADEPTEAEAATVERMLATITPRQIATAYLRATATDRSAPEDIEILNVKAPAARKHDRSAPAAGTGRDNFSDSIWLSLSVGRKQRAEPRWLIPALCKGGDITKAAIGMIRMRENDTIVELDAAEADGFLERIGPDRTLERGMRVKVLDAKPNLGPAPKGGFKKPPAKGGYKGKPSARKEGTNGPGTEAKKGGPPWKKKPGKPKPGGKPVGKPKKRDG